MGEFEPTLFGKYRLIERLGRGDVAEVFRATSSGVEGFEKTLVVRRVLPELADDGSFVEAFVREAKLAVTLSHANVVQVFDLGCVEGLYYLAMEWVAGVDLRSLEERSRRVGAAVPPDLAIHIVAEIAKGLDYTHRRRDASQRPLGLVHRAVSPSNILVSVEGEVKLADFGLARARDAMRSPAPPDVRRIQYQSPEQARGEACDARSDLYSLGVVLVELLSGRHPLEGLSADEAIARIASGTQLDVSDLEGADPSLVSLVGRLVDPNPERRTAKAGVLYEELIQLQYATRRRVGSQDLARHVRRVQEALPAPDEAIRAAFDTSVLAPAIAISRPSELRDGAVVRLRGHGVRARLGSVESLSVLRRYGAFVLEGSDADDVALHVGVRAPDGHDAENSVRCALRLLGSTGRDELRAPFVGSAGVALGRFVVDPRGEPVVDDSLRAALRDAEGALLLAGPQQVCLTSAVARALGPAFDTSRVFEESDEIHRVDGVLAASEPAGRWVGRREELRELGDIFAEAARGSLRVIAITGGAGLGKSRLLVEARRRLRAAGHDVGVFLATTSRTEKDVPLSALQGLLRSILGIDELDPPETVRDRLVRARELGLDAGEIGALGVLLGAAAAPDSPELLTDRIGRAFVRVVIRLALDRLTVLAIDGSDALDPASRRVLEGLLTSAAECRIVCILAGSAPPPGFMVTHTIPLRPLRDEEVVRMVTHRLGTADIPRELASWIVHRASGNPLHVDATLDTLMDRGAIAVQGDTVELRLDLASIEVPRTLRALISARLARLDPTERLLLQLAALSRGRFVLPALARAMSTSSDMAEAACVRLELEGLVSRVGNQRVIASELIRDAAQDAIPLPERRALHGALANAFSIDAGHVEALELAAWHARTAGDFDRARKLYDDAFRIGDLATPAVAMRIAAAAIELESASPGSVDRRLRLHLDHARAAHAARAGRLGIPTARAGMELAAAHGVPSAEGMLSVLLGRFLVQIGEVDEAQRWIERGCGIAASLEDAALLRAGTLARAEAALRGGDPREAVVALERTAADALDAGDLREAFLASVQLVVASALTGDFSAARARQAAAARIFAEPRLPHVEFDLRNAEAVVALLAGDAGAAVEHASAAADVAAENDLPQRHAIALHNVGEACLRTGDLGRAFASLRASDDLARSHGIDALHQANARGLAYLDALQPEGADGMERLRAARTYARERQLTWEWLQGGAMVARVQQRHGDLDGARDTLREARGTAMSTGFTALAEGMDRALVQLEGGVAIGLP